MGYIQIDIKAIEWFDDRFYRIQVAEKENNPVYEYFASVTTKLGIIAKPFLARWRGDVGNREADMRVFEASERGVRIHAAWYTLTTGGAVIYNPNPRPNYTPGEIESLEGQYDANLAILRYQDEMYDLWKLQRWLDIVKPKVFGSELTVYSLLNKDAGTVDNIFELEAGEYAISGAKPLKLPGGRYIVDLKSGNAVDDNAFMQTAAYAKCYEEMGLGEIVGTIILHTGSKIKTGIEGLATLYRSKEEMEQDYVDYRLAAALWERKHKNDSPHIFEFPSLLLYGKNENKKI